MPSLQGAPHVSADQEPRRRRRRTEEGVLDTNQLEVRAACFGKLGEQLGHQRRHRDTCDHPDAPPGKTRQAR